MVAGAAANTAKKSFWSIWYKPEIIPIYVTVGAACGLAGYYLTRLAR
jgi:NADH dehydrogenase (ubiquinone) 1 alpha subcomplex subunit 4